jgi:hypothetical protein
MRIVVADFEIGEVVIDSYYSRRQAADRIIEAPLLLVCFLISILANLTSD